MDQKETRVKLAGVCITLSLFYAFIKYLLDTT